MPINIACVSCGTFFEPDPDELKTFIVEQADLKYLRRIPFPPQYHDQYESRESFVASLLMGYCPYCREVKFGRAASPGLPNDKLAVERYIRAFKTEMKKHGGYQVVESPDYVALVDTDEN